MRKLLLLCLLSSAFIGLPMPSASGQVHREQLPNLDRRVPAQQPAAQARRSAVAALESRVPRIKVEFDEITGGPKVVSAKDGFLTGPAAQGGAVSAATAAGFDRDPDQAAKAFVQEHRELFGHGPEALGAAQVKRQSVGAKNGLRSVVWQQQAADIPVFEALFVAHTTRAGELVTVSSTFIPEPEAAASNANARAARSSAVPRVSAPAAIRTAAAGIGDDVAEGQVISVLPSSGPEMREKFQVGGLSGETTVSLTWLPMNREELRLCWDVVLTSSSRGEMFRLLVDAETAEVLVRRNLTDYLTDATYRVFTSDSPAPMSPGHSTPLTTQPPVVSRSLITVSALNTNASPLGWISDGNNETLGNNVDAHTDRNNDNVADLPRPQGSPFRTFDFAMDLSSQNPTNYSQAAVVQLFYTCNWVHDRLYDLGFTETAGNFQTDNFGRGGLGNDPVLADAQDGGGFNNANFSTPPDGSPGRMQMYIFDGPTPDRDGDFDAEIVIHEYVHGLSNRRVGGGVGLSALQSRGMGEGWSDFYPMAMLSEPGDNINACYAAGGYATYLLSGLTENYYYGIRRYPYSTDMTKNPLTFKDIDTAQASPHTGVPRSPIIGNTATEVHNMGEVWCATLWDARANLIQKHGWAVGNELILELVTDGMNLSPANPNFLQARDAILQADLVNNAGANRNQLWAAFAKRGMGSSATSPVSSTTSGLVESYDLPDDLLVAPSTIFSSQGQIGGPFSPSCQTYTVKNTGSNVLSWSGWTMQPWITLSPSNGVLASGATTAVTVCIAPSANALTASSYSGTAIFSNAVSGMAQSRSVSLYVSPPRVLFFSMDTDPGWQRTSPWAFGKPAGLGGTSHGFPDPSLGASGTNVFGVNLSGDYSTTVGGPYYLTAGPFDFTGFTGIKLQFQRWLNTDYPSYVYATIEVSSNGVNWTGIWTNSSGVFVTDNAWSRFTYDIASYADNRSGVYVRWGHRVASTGAYAFSGWNLDDVEFLGVPLQALTINIPTNTVEGSSTLSGTVAVNPVQTNTLVISLLSSDTSEITVPSSVTINAGQSNAVFALTVMNDDDLDGPQSVTISASVPGAQPGSGMITVQDNETATLQVSLPASAIEGQGTFVGSVKASELVDANITVALTSSDPLEITVPPTVVIPAGMSNASFVVTVEDDMRIDGTQTPSVSAAVANWTGASQSIQVHDNESTALTVLLNGPVYEHAGPVSNAAFVSLSGTLSTNLTVNLSSGTPGRLGVQANTVIAAGSLNAAFALMPADNAAIDGHVVVTITGTAAGFTDGTGTITLLDDESPPVPVLLWPTNFATEVWQITSLVWSNAEFGGKTVTNDIYLGTSPSLGAAEKIASTTNSLWALPQLAPETTYYWKVVARSGGTASSDVWRFTTRGVHHFEWAPIPVSQIVGTPFAVTISARDEFGALVTNFNSSVSLGAFTGGNPGTGSQILVLQTTESAASVGAALNNLGKSYDLMTYTSMSSVNLSNYSTIIFALNGGSISYSDMQQLAASVSTGRRLIIVGGSALPSYVMGLNDFLIRVNTNSYDWVSFSGAPHVGLKDPGHPLAAGLPASTTFSNLSLTYYMARVTDDTASVAATNLHGYAWLSSKAVGSGSVVMLVTPATAGFWGSPSDLAILQTILSNALQDAVLLPISPEITGAFTNGAWSGNITVQAPGTNVSLRAQDAANHTGTANPINVHLENDLEITMIDLPDPISAGATLTYTIAVTNYGPAAATQVQLTNQLPAGVAFVSASSSQGSCSQAGGIVSASLGSLPGGGQASVTIQVVPGTAGTVITNTASIFRGETDPFLANNSAQAVTLVTPPAISVANTLVAEGNVGTNTMLFSVSLQVPSAQPVSVQYTANTGTAVAGVDFVPATGTLVFLPGVTNLTIPVQIIGDVVIEPSEVVILTLQNATNGIILVGTASGTIQNDDGLPGKVDHFVWNTVPSPQAANVPFGVQIAAQDVFNNPVTTFNGTVNFSGSVGGLLSSGTILGDLAHTGYSTGTYTLGYAFTPSTTLTLTHFRSYSGTKVSLWKMDGTLLTSKAVSNAGGAWVETPVDPPVTLQAGTTYVLGFYTSGGTFYLRYEQTNSFPHGTILPGYYYVASDGFPGNNYNTPTVYLVDLRYTTGAQQEIAVSPLVSGAFTNGIWSGEMTVQEPGTNVWLKADDADGHFGLSNPLNIGLQNDVAISASGTPEPVTVNGLLTYVISVNNTGPQPATGVSVTNWLPGGTTFVSAETSQGSWSQSGQVVSASLGTLQAGSNATVTISVTPFTAGIPLTNSAAVYRAEPDGYAGNNTALTVNTVVPPTVVVSDASILEGNVGTKQVVLPVTISTVSSLPVSFNYSTVGGSATGSDYFSTNGTVVIPPGSTNGSVVVTIKGDISVEPDEIFYVALSSPANCVLSNQQPTVTITNDDGFPGQVYYFQFSAIASPNQVGVPIPVAISAMDYFGAVVTNFVESVSLNGYIPSPSNSIPISPVISGPFDNGQWSGVVTVTTAATNMLLRAEDGDGHSSVSNPFHVLSSNHPPYFVIQPGNTVAYLNGATNLSASVYGSGPLGYQWRRNGVDIPGATNLTLNLGPLKIADGGIYNVIASNAFGVASSAKAVLSVVQVAAWGAGTNAFLSNFNYGQSMVPPGLTNATGLAGGLYHSLAVREDGLVSAWGAGTNLVGGQSPNYGQSVVPPVGSVIAVAAGGYHSLALREDGTLQAWGAGTNSTLYSQPHYRQSVIPAAASNIVAIAAGDYHSVALRNDGRVLAWGYNGSFQTNVPAAAMSNVVAIASRGNHVLALRNDGVLVHWGSLTSLPSLVSNIVSIAAGVNHCLALKADGTVVAWGNQTAPLGLTNIVEIGAGQDHSVVLTGDGRIITWGQTNLYGRHAIPAGLTNVYGIACGAYHSLAWLGDGSPRIKFHPSGRTVLAGMATTFNVLAAGPQLRYQWQRNGTNLLGATNSAYSIQGIQAPHVGDYRVIITNSLGAVTSSIASLKVVLPLATALDNGSYIWTTTGNGLWFGQTVISHDGVDAAQSGGVSNLQQSALQTTVSGPGSVQFWWKVSSEEYFDAFSFTIDGIVQVAASGETGWQQSTFTFGSGSHLLRWSYVKDGSISAGADAAWVDQVSVTLDPPLITLQPTSQTNWQGETVVLALGVSGASPITVQWYQNGSNFIGTTSGALILGGLNRWNSGTYHAVASNAGGSVNSSNAFLKVLTPQVISSSQFGEGGFRIVSGDRGGSGIGEQDLAAFEVLTSTNLADWTICPASLSVTNGQLLIIDSSYTNDSVRFYRIVEH